MLLDANSLRSALLKADNRIKWKVIGLGNDVFVSWNGQPSIALGCDKDILKAVDLCLFGARKFINTNYIEPQKITFGNTKSREIKSEQERVAWAAAKKRKEAKQSSYVKAVESKIVGQFVNKGSAQNLPSDVVSSRYSFYDKRREEILGFDSGEYCFSSSILGSRPRLCDDGPTLYDRIDMAMSLAMGDGYSQHGMFLGDEMDMTYTDQKNGLQFYGHDRSGHSGRTRHAALV